MLESGSAQMGTCLLLDIHLGGISGIELQRRLAASGTKCPVIFMTANDDEATRNEAVDAGCIGYLRKPFARQVLLNAIGKAVAGCVKTCASRECAELFSVLSPFYCDWQQCSFPIERNRDNISTCKFDVGVFTQPGSKTEVSGLARHVRFTLRSRYRQPAPPCPFGARSGRRPTKWWFRKATQLSVDDLPRPSRKC